MMMKIIHKKKPNLIIKIIKAVILFDYLFNSLPKKNYFLQLG